LISQQDFADFLQAKRCGQLAEAEMLLVKMVGATEAQAKATGCGVAPWYYEQLAIFYRKQKRYDAEIEILERYGKAPKAPGVGPYKLAIRLEEALLVREEGRNGPKLRLLRAARARASEVTLQTNLGEITIRNPYGGSIAIIAAGQSEEHLRWYFNIHRKEELERAVVDLNRLLRDGKQQLRWNDAYVKFVQSAPALLAALPQKLETALRENQAMLDRKAARVIWGPYNTSRQRADFAAKMLSFGALLTAREIEASFKCRAAAEEREEQSLIGGSALESSEDRESELDDLRYVEPTLNAGWLNVQVIAIPPPSRG
jgi:hypothetical protein